MNNDLCAAVRQDLKQQGDEKTRESARRFFKEPILTYGVSSPAAGKIARKYLPEIKQLGKAATFALCEELFKSDYQEEAFIACDWAYAWQGKYETGDFETLERWVARYVNDWAKCDTLCNHTVGAFIEQYPAYLDRLKGWAREENRWRRRAAAVSLILPARHGLFLSEIFEIADILLRDPDDLVQKGYGWMLKAASESHQTAVFDYVMGRKALMPRTALRYAIEKMPENLRKQAMAKS
jgi:3-methyladenine DNA glycosylase AlkD